MQKKTTAGKKTGKSSVNKNKDSKLIIVESPTKAKTIKKYLGSGYEVIASMGHLRDLPKSKMGVNIEENFEPQYIPIRGKGDIINSLKKEARRSSRVYLATDPDREGEAISWHLSQMLGLPDEPNRVTFNEITKATVTREIKNPRSIDMNRVNAQQARRILDRIVGYKLSPVLWKRIKKGLSAGRVQSVATKLIVDRENEINEFIPKEYWTIVSKLQGSSKGQFDARFYGDEKAKIELLNKESADKVLNDVESAEYIVKSIKNGVKRRSPSAPFTTSTLQQEASKKLNFQARRTMQTAQELYEGVDIKGHGTVGLITYMRTDSLRISDEAVREAKEFIIGKYGQKYYPDTPKVYKAKGKVQDAHEAIRPTYVSYMPQDIKESLSADQYKLYKLIWERFVSSQMASAVLDTVNADILANGYIFRTSGFTVKFDGFMQVYEESAYSDENNVSLPPMSEGEKLKFKSIKSDQHFTQPPPRYTEASLIKELEENGIGRPSTYAPTITTILARGYVQKEGKTLAPTVLGIVTTDLMKNHFDSIVDIEFTAKMEDDLDGVESGEKEWQDALSAFYTKFKSTMEKAEEDLGDLQIKVPDEVSDEVCEHCGRNMVVKLGRYGKFLACPGYPECKNTKPIIQDTGAKCPKCDGRVIIKKSKNKMKYYGCEFNPKCDFMTWDEPKKDLCPKCGRMLYRKAKQNKLYCVTPDCGYEVEMKSKDEQKEEKND